MKIYSILVSIIIPVYNIEKYLAKCLDSVVNQTYKNIEIIVVNDGSTDSSCEICQEYLRKDPRIIILNKKNGGLSSARNYGLEQIKGKYVMFIDGDDWIDAHCIESCMNNVDESIDVILFPYIREYTNKSIKNDIFKENRIDFEENHIKDVLLKRIFGLSKENINKPDRLEDLSSAWGKLYRSDLVKNEKFVDTKIIRTEDIWFNINILYKCKKVIFIKSTYYHYNKENMLSLTKEYNPGIFERRYNLYKLMNKFILDNNLSEEFSEALNNRIVINLLGLNRSILNSNLKLSNKLKEVKLLLANKIYEEAFNNFRFNNLEFKWKLYYKACYKKNVYLVLLITKFAEILKKYVK